MCCLIRQVEVNVHDCKWLDVKCLVFIVSIAWEIIVFICNTIKGLISGTSETKLLLDIVIF